MSIITVTGNTSAVEIKQLPNVGAYAKFSIAENYKVKTEDKTDWYNITAFDRVCEQAAKLEKGTRVSVVGRLRLREHNGKTYLDVVAFDISVLNKPIQKTQSQQELEDVEF